MQVFYPGTTVTILLVFAIWAAVPLLLAWVCLLLPDSLYDPKRLLWRTYAWERDGLFYERVFHIKHWKHLLPDGGGVWKSHAYHKRTLSDYSEANLRRFLIESARGELTHWLGILPFWVFGLFTPPGVIWIMLVYALLINLPCIIAQRYNRPRILRLMQRLYPHMDAQ